MGNSTYAHARTHARTHAQEYLGCLVDVCYLVEQQLDDLEVSKLSSSDKGCISVLTIYVYNLNIYIYIYTLAAAIWCLQPGGWLGGREGKYCREPLRPGSDWQDKLTKNGQYKPVWEGEETGVIL